MVERATLEAISNFVSNLEKVYGDISFAVAIPNSVGAENASATLFLASPWIDKSGLKNSLSLIIKELRKEFGEDSGAVVSRISLVNANDALVKEFSPITAYGGITTFVDCMLNNVHVPEAHVFLNKRVS